MQGYCQQNDNMDIRVVGSCYSGIILFAHDGKTPRQLIPRCYLIVLKELGLDSPGYIDNSDSAATQQTVWMPMI